MVNEVRSLLLVDLVELGLSLLEDVESELVLLSGSVRESHISDVLNKLLLDSDERWLLRFASDEVSTGEGFADS